MKIQHITIQVKDLERSAKFYQEVLGLTIQGDLRAQGGPPIVFLADGAGETAVELIENKAQSYSGTGISIGFHVEDVEAARQAMEEKGLAPTPMLSPVPQTRFFFIQDPDGVQIQLI